MKKITILIPAYNEEEVIDLLYQRVKKVIDKLEYDFEVLFVNDGSKDNTLDNIKKIKEKDKRIVYVNLSRNFGKEIAMAAGLDYATGDAVIIMDADLQDPPELIEKMVEEWENGYDDVYAKRKSRKGETALKKFTSYLFYRVLKSVSRVEIQEDTGDFRLLSRKTVEALKKMRENQRYTKGLFSWVGFKKKEILFDREPRIAGKTKWNYLKLMELAIEGITSFTTAPLRIASVVGSIVSLIALIYMLYIIGITVLYGNPVAGYPSMLSIILFLGGIQLLSLGIIGEYIGRIFNETKNRPIYFIDEYSEDFNRRN